MKKDHTEVNVSVWHRETIQSVRKRLLSEHLGYDISSITSGKEDLLLTARIARENRKLIDNRTSHKGLIFALDTANYGTIPSYLSILEKGSLIISNIVITIFENVPPLNISVTVLALLFLILILYLIK